MAAAHIRLAGLDTFIQNDICLTCVDCVYETAHCCLLVGLKLGVCDVTQSMVQVCLKPYYLIFFLPSSSHPDYAVG